MNRVSGKLWYLHTSVPLLAAILWAVPVSLQASILLPDETPLDIEQLLADADLQSGSSSSSSTSPEQCPAGVPLNRQHDDTDQPSEVLFLQSQTSTGGTTSGTSTSTSGTSGTSVFPIDSVAAVALSDVELVAWIGGERRFTLPMPPGNDLLRPPQQS